MSKLGEKLIRAAEEAIAIARCMGAGSRCPHPVDCDEDGCTGHCADVRRYGLVTDDMPRPVDNHHKG